jgi:hypothetical protein
MKQLRNLAVVALVGCAAALGACGEEATGPTDGSRRDVLRADGADGGSGTMDGSMQFRDVLPIEIYSRDVRPDPDAFFAMNPPPMTCYADGGRGTPPMPPGGTPECPDDLIRQGCECPLERIGQTVPCWPGLRVNRNRGICRDGMARCNEFDELSGRWGPCEGYVLPTPGVTRGPGACRCFSMGRWAIENLSPCFVDYMAAGVYAVSTFQNASGMPSCPTAPFTTPPPAPQPGQPWSRNSLTVDCTGQFELCYTLRAGNAMMPLATDCILARVCTRAWYMTANMTQTLPPLPSWVGSSPTCARAFRDTGGYGEMSVRGLSSDCADIDDGMGNPYVFVRVNYCPLRCNTMPTLPECRGCMSGGSGMF